MSLSASWTEQATSSFSTDELPLPYKLRLEGHGAKAVNLAVDVVVTVG